MSFLRCSSIIVFILIQVTLGAQQQKTDSLKQVLEKLPALGKDKKKDMLRVAILSDLGWLVFNTDPDHGVSFMRKAQKAAGTMKWHEQVAILNNNLGTLYKERGEFNASMKYYADALAYWTERNKTTWFKNKKFVLGKIAAVTSNLGIAYLFTGDYPHALDCFYKALKLDEFLEDDYGIGVDLANIGLVYSEQDEFKPAFDYFNKALKAHIKAGSDGDVALAYGNLGVLYRRQKRYNEALKYYIKSTEIDKRMGYLNGLARQYGNIGAVYENLGDSAYRAGNVKTADEIYFARAAEYFLKAIETSIQAGDKSTQSVNYSNLGSLYMMRKNLKPPLGETRSGYALAEYYLDKSLAICDSTGALSIKKSMLMPLVDLYERTGRSAKALVTYKLFIKVRDSVTNSENIKKQTRLEADHEYSIKEAKTREKQLRKDALAEKEKKAQRIILVAVIGGLVLVFLLALVIFRSLRQNQKKNKIITRQKSMVEEKQMEIIDSITYAGRIQRSLLPSETYIQNALNRLNRQK